MTLPSGLVLDFTNMFGTDRLQDEEVALSLETIGAAAAAAVDSLRATGRSKAHLSKDGTPEHVYFPRMPYIAAGNPNDEASIKKLKEYGEYLMRSGRNKYNDRKRKHIAKGVAKA